MSAARSTPEFVSPSSQDTCSCGARLTGGFARCEHCRLRARLSTQKTRPIEPLWKKALRQRERQQEREMRRSGDGTVRRRTPKPPPKTIHMRRRTRVWSSGRPPKPPALGERCTCEAGDLVTCVLITEAWTKIIRACGVCASHAPIGTLVRGLDFVKPEGV